MPPATAESGLRNAFSSLRHRDFALFWAAALVSNTGSWMQSITVPYVLYVLTRSTTWLGISAFVAFFPALVMGPLAGTLSDRFERRRILIITQSAQMAVAFSLWGFWVTGRATPGNLLANLLVYGIAAGVNITSWQSFVPLLVPRDALLNAVRLNSMQFTAARAFGPALAGLVLARFGASTAFMANALTFLLVIAALLAVHPRSTPQATAVPFRRQFADGLTYVLDREALLLAVLTILAVSFFGSSIIQLAPAVAKEQFHVGKAAYGVLVAAFGGGAILGSVVMSAWGDAARRSRMALFGVFLFAAGVLLLAVAPAYRAGLVALFVMGVAYLLVAVSLNTSIQVRVAEDYRGRVLSIYLMGLLAGVPLGALAEGRLGDAIGLRPTVAAAGVALVVFAVVAAARFAGMAPLDEVLEDT